ncbi:RNA-binding protein [Candidatus Woesearchaeota archaeon]|jgi:exosome complex component RRP4|nr:RNA-binding protein [Candidatus Woesearchaeota archaeon]
MSELLIQDKTVVVPGEVLANGMDYLPSFGTYRENDRIFAGRLGLLNIDGKVLKILPLSGKYLPKKGDTIIACTTEILMNGWRVDTNSAYEAVLTVKEASSDFIERGADLTKYFDIGDYMMTKVVNVTSQNLVDISMRGPGLRKLTGGRFIKVNTHKVPRIIGKQGSMVTLVKQFTNCRILVGQNGVVWIKGDDPSDELLAVTTMKKIEKEAHLPGLTDRVKEYLEGLRPDRKNV